MQHAAQIVLSVVSPTPGVVPKAPPRAPVPIHAVDGEHPQPRQRRPGQAPVVPLRVPVARPAAETFDVWGSVWVLDVGFPFGSHQKHPNAYIGGIFGAFVVRLFFLFCAIIPTTETGPHCGLRATLPRESPLVFLWN